MSRDAKYVTKDMAPVPAGSAADYKAGFAQRSASAFAAAFAEDVLLEATGMYWPLSGRENVHGLLAEARRTRRRGESRVGKVIADEKKRPSTAAENVQPQVLFHPSSTPLILEACNDQCCAHEESVPRVDRK